MGSLWNPVSIMKRDFSFFRIVSIYLIALRVIAQTFATTSFAKDMQRSRQIDLFQNVLCQAIRVYNQMMNNKFQGEYYEL
jgi:hypothetical protein